MPFFKLWRTSSAVETLIPPPEYEDEDSFFDLELNKLLNIPKITINNTSDSENSDNESFENSPKSFDSRSPISFLRSPAKIPSFFMPKKKPISVNSSPANSPMLSRENSYKKKSQNPKETVFKYMKLIRVRVLKSSGESSGEYPGENSPDREGMRSPSMRFVRRSKSAVAGVFPVARVSEDSVLQSDGIQGAILHCKRSYNSSRDLSVLSRSVSEPVISVNPSRFSIEEKNRISI